MWAWHCSIDSVDLCRRIVEGLHGYFAHVLAEIRIAVRDKAALEIWSAQAFRIFVRTCHALRSDFHHVHQSMQLFDLFGGYATGLAVFRIHPLVHAVWNASFANYVAGANHDW